MIDQVAVVVPARNEARRINATLASLERAAAHLAAVTTRIIVVLDRCTDGTAAVVARFPAVEVLITGVGRVGAARALGVEHAITTRAGSLEGLWLACTDADSLVPHHWLTQQVAAADGGAALVLGTVRPTLAPAGLHRWRQAHVLADGHPHVHGANLGVAAETYVAVGGFPDVAEHEDRMLAELIRDSGAPVLASDGAPVITSARTTGRTPGGFARYLRELPQDRDAG